MKTRHESEHAEVTIPIRFTGSDGLSATTQAWALATFIRRVGWEEIVGNAVDKAEATAMRDAILVLQSTLADAGFDVR